MTTLGDVRLKPSASTDEAESNDQMLVRAAAKSSEAFTGLYQRYMPAVYRYMLARTADSHDAQDLTTQTFMAALNGLGRYRGEGPFAAWLFGIARRQVAAFYRSRRATQPLDTADVLPALDEPLDELAGRTIRLGQVIAAMKTLPADREEALALRFFAGLAVADIAQAMERSEAAVRMLVHRAIEDLKQLLVNEDE